MFFFQGFVVNNYSALFATSRVNDEQFDSRIFLFVEVVLEVEPPLCLQHFWTNLTVSLLVFDVSFRNPSPLGHDLPTLQAVNLFFFIEKVAVATQNAPLEFV